VHDAVREDPDVGILEALDALAALHASRKQREDALRDRVENGVVVFHVGSLLPR
jgi:hypothetical protein